MSETSQGPGWWLASDGRWYPPQAIPAYPAPAGYPPQAIPAPIKKSRSGCLTAVLVLVGLIVFAGIGVVVLISRFADDVVDGALGGGPCPFLSDGQAAAALGDGTTAIEARGITRALVIVDPRVMPDDPSCVLSRDSGDSEGDSGGLGRVARYRGPRAAEKYRAELTKAKGVTENRGDGLSVSSESYLNKVVDGIGDEAFCTKSSGVGAGVLVRRGDKLVYVSVVADVDTAPGVDLSDPDNPKLGTDDLHCELAQTIAGDVLG